MSLIQLMISLFYQLQWIIDSHVLRFLGIDLNGRAILIIYNIIILLSCNLPLLYILET